MRMRRWTVLMGALTLLLLSHWPMLAGTTWLNAGMLELSDRLLHADSAPGAYPVHEALPQALGTSRATQRLQRAVVLGGDDFSAQWALGRAALAAGDAETAADVLKPLMGKAGHNPLLYQDVLVSFSYGGRLEDLLAFYESTPHPQYTQVISDAVALAYLERSRSAGERRDEQAIARAAGLRPGDLYANYHLWRAAMEAGDGEAAAVYSEALTYFPLEAISPADERLLDYAAEVIPALLDGGIWDRDKTLNVVSFLVWQRNAATGVERLLEQLIERYPTEPDWPFYLGELYDHQGNLDQAEAAYQQVAVVDSEYAQAYLRLGMVAEGKAQIPNPESQEQLKEAAEWYERYYEMAPDDLLGFKRLADVCSSLEEAGIESESCQQAALHVSGSQSRVGSETLNSRPEPSPAEVLWNEWLERVAAVDPEYLVGQQLDNGWTFLGYDMDETRLIRGEPVDILLCWVGPVTATAGPEQDGWNRAGGRWVQVLHGVRNLVPNGGFELGLEGGSPGGFPLDIYSADPDTRRLATDSRAGWHTTVALLDNTEVYSYTSFASSCLPIDPGGLYLQAGWLRSAGGNGYLGRCWIGDIPEDVWPQDYVVAGVTADDWQHYAGVTQPLKGAVCGQIWLLNYMTVGRAYFDNILFVEIGRPGQ